MKYALGIALAAVLCTAPAMAGDMTGLYGNTIMCTYPNGAVTKVHVQEGGKYNLEREGKTVQGTWVDSGEQVCYTEVDPAPPAGTKPICTPSAAMKVGATWSVTDSAGNASHCELKAGVQ